MSDQDAPVITYIATVHVTGLSSISALTILAWDWLISFSDEVHLIWQRPNGWFMWLYAFIRYFPLCAEIGLFAYLHAQPVEGGISAATCDIMSSIEGVITTSIVIGVELVIMVRVWILYDRNQFVLVLLVAALLASFVAAVICTYISSKHWSYNEHCIIISSSSSAIILVWAAPIAFETALFGMTIAKFGQSRTEGLGKRPILDTIVRDGTWAYILAITVMALNILVYTRFVDGLSGIVYFWTISVLSYVGSHVLLNLRRLGSGPLLSGNVSIMTDVRFEDPYVEDIPE